jgi:hypothetical protein
MLNALIYVNFLARSKSGLVDEDPKTAGLADAKMT